MNYDQWQKHEEENIDGLHSLANRLVSGRKIDLWDVVPELELGKSKLVWGMLSPQSVREGYVISRPQVFLLPINAPQYEGWSFQREYGHGPLWLAELIETCPDRIRPVITAQPLDYKPYPKYDKIFEACREVYRDEYPPCSQWRIDTLLSKYRMACNEEFKAYFSDKYFQLAKNHWASKVMETLGFPSQVKPESIEGRRLRHFLAVSYSLAYLGLDTLVKHVVATCSTYVGVGPHKRMDFAWRILDPYHDYLARPLRSDLAGLHLNKVNKTEAVRALQLVLPLTGKNQVLSRKLVSRFKHKVNIEKEQIELIKRLGAGVSLEFILRVNFIMEGKMFMPKTKYLEKTTLNDIIAKDDDEYAAHLYRVWRELYNNGKVEKSLLDNLFELSEKYTLQVKEVVQKKLRRKVKIEKLKTVAGALASSVAAGYGLSELWGMSLQPLEIPRVTFWSLESTLSLFSIVQTIRNLIRIEEVTKGKIAEKLTKNIFKGNIVDIEMLHSLSV